jgi:hypothetical protein
MILKCFFIEITPCNTLELEDLLIWFVIDLLQVALIIDLLQIALTLSRMFLTDVQILSESCSCPYCINSVRRIMHISLATRRIFNTEKNI